MTPSPDDIFTWALALPAEDRAVLAEKLLDSLGGTDHEQVDAAWSEEVEHRIESYDEVKVQAIPGNEVMRSVRSRKQP